MKVKIFYFILLLLQFSHISGQVHRQMQKINVDSLQYILPTLEGQSRIDAFNKLSLAYCRNYPDSSIQFANKSIAISEKQGYRKGQADGYFNLGMAYLYKDGLKLAIINYLAALRIYEEIDPTSEHAETLMQLAILKRFAGRNDQALLYGKEAMNIYISVSNPRGQTYAYHQVASIFNGLNEMDSSFHYYDMAIQVLEKSPDTWRLQSIYHNYGFNYVSQYKSGQTDKKNLLKAIPWFLKSLKLYSFNDIDHRKAITYLHIGEAYNLTENKEYRNEGLRYIKIAKNILDTIRPYLFPTTKIYQIFALEKVRLGKNEEAIQLLKLGIAHTDSALSMFSFKNYEFSTLGYYDRYYMKYYKELLYEELYRIYKVKNDYKKALEYYILKEKAAEEVFLEDNRKLIEILEADSENEKANNQIAMLEKENEVKDLKIQQSRIYLLALGGFVLIIILMALLFVRQNKMRAEHNTVILEQKLLRLQMNPHFIFNALSNILNFVNRKDTVNATNYLTSFSRLLRTTLESSREDYIVLEEEIISIKNYLDLQLLRYEDKFDYSIDVDENIDKENSIIPPMLIQPFIENAIEHGISHKETKGNIIVRFKLENKMVICEVEDDGVGRKKAWEAEFQKRKTHKSLATEIIKDRIQSLNKKLKQKINLSIIDLKTDADEPIGTRVVLNIPYLID